MRSAEKVSEASDHAWDFLVIKVDSYAPFPKTSLFGDPNAVDGAGLGLVKDDISLCQWVIVVVTVVPSAMIAIAASWVKRRYLMDSRTVLEIR